MPQAIGLIGALAGAASQYQQGQDAKAYARNNAILQEAQADAELQQSTAIQSRYRQQLNQFLGRQRATIAANNVQNSGSALRLQEDAAGFGEEDLANIRNQAALNAWGIRTGAANTREQGDAYARAATGSAIGSLASAYRPEYGSAISRTVKRYRGLTPKTVDALSRSTDNYILGGYRQAYGSGY